MSQVTNWPLGSRVFSTNDTKSEKNRAEKNDQESKFRFGLFGGKSSPYDRLSETLKEHVKTDVTRPIGWMDSIDRVQES